MFFIASGLPLKWLVKFMPILSGFRHTPLLAGLAIPAVLGLAGYGLDHLLRVSWPQLKLQLPPSTSFGMALNLKWILIIPLIWSLHSAYGLARNWIATSDRQELYDSISELATSDLRWISFPYGEHFWVEPALHEELKVTNVAWAWSWRGRDLPLPRLEANRAGPPAGSEQVGEISGTPLYLNTTREYSIVEQGNQSVPCNATGSGGDIFVECSTNSPGRLILQENYWSGWYAWRDGERVLLLDSQWLSVDAPAGQHEYRFRYLPIDVLIGMILTITGFAITIWLWRRSSPTSLVDIRANAGFERNEEKKDQDLEPL